MIWLVKIQLNKWNFVLQMFHTNDIISVNVKPRALDN